jgi:uncharacterized protein associated with vWA-MoxR-VMAP ternary system
MTTQRTQVLWIGPRPSKNVFAEFERRNLVLTPVRKPLTDDNFRVSRAAIFRFDDEKKGESIGFVKRYASLASDHGLLVILHASSQQEIRMLQAHLTNFPEVPPTFVDFSRPIKQFSVRKPPYELAEMAARHPAGPAFNPDLEISGELPEKEEDLFLLRRSFSDCRTIKLRALKKGFSGARVFTVYAEFPPGEAAPFPLPYFAKIDSWQHIMDEYRNMERFVTRYVPFNQRPNCEPKRCFVGSKDGIIVGDFVDNSEPLADLVQPNGARGIIHSLFDDALRGWRQQAYVSKERISLPEFRPKILKPEQIKGAHETQARKFGAKMNPHELTRLLDGSTKHFYRRGPVHGDLTTQNVLVRNGEAVLIDFCKSSIGPLAADLASLEIAICFSLEADTSWHAGDEFYEESPRFTEWRRHIDRLFLFVPGEFGLVPPSEEQPSGHNWMWSACRQLRLMAHYIEPNERAYAYLLAAYLLRMTQYPNEAEKIHPQTPDSTVRAYAYWCAERILRAITTKKEAA